MAQSLSHGAGRQALQGQVWEARTAVAGEGVAGAIGGLEELALRGVKQEVRCMADSWRRAIPGMGRASQNVLSQDCV